MNVNPKGVYFPISKLHSILAVANLLAQNIISQICYCGQISLQCAAVFLTPFGVTFILLGMVHSFGMLAPTKAQKFSLTEPTGNWSQ